MNCTNPVTIRVKYSSNPPIPPADYKPEWMTVACGKCLSCRITHRRQWSMRCVHEFHTSMSLGLFVTLTYKDEYLPPNRSLVVRDVQLFNKRLNKALKQKYGSSHRYKYLIAGEYGDRTSRPHYHALFFGIGFKDADIVRSCWKFCDWEKLEASARARGTLGPIGTITEKSANYVCGYVDKKYGGIIGEEIYEQTGRIPPFRLLSKGIGRSYVDAYASQIATNMYIDFNRKPVSVPRYYFNRLVLVHGFHPAWLRGNIPYSRTDHEIQLINETIGYELNMTEESLNYYFPPRGPQSVGYANYVRFNLNWQLAKKADIEAKRERISHALSRRRNGATF